MDAHQVGTRGLRPDLSKSGVYFTVPAEVNTRQMLRLGIELPEDNMPSATCHSAAGLAASFPSFSLAYSRRRTFAMGKTPCWRAASAPAAQMPTHWRSQLLR